MKYYIINFSLPNKPKFVLESAKAHRSPRVDPVALCCALRSVFVFGMAAFFGVVFCAVPPELETF